MDEHVSERSELTGEWYAPNDVDYEDVVQGLQQEEVKIYIDVREFDEVHETGKIPKSRVIPREFIAFFHGSVIHCHHRHHLHQYRRRHHHHLHYCAAVVSRSWAKASQHAASTSAYLALSSVRWYPSSRRLVRLSVVLPVFLYIISLRRVSRWRYATSISYLLFC